MKSNNKKIRKHMRVVEFIVRNSNLDKMPREHKKQVFDSTLSIIKMV